MLATALDCFVTFNPWTLSPTTPLTEAARQLEECGVTAWPVVDDNDALLGIVTADRLASSVSTDPHRNVTTCLDTRAKSIELDATPLQALEQLLTRRVRMLPVVDAGRIVGTLAMCDFLRELAQLSPRGARELIVDHLHKGGETIDGDATLEQGLAALAEGAKYLVVVQGDFPLGALTAETLAIAGVQQFARRMSGASSAERTVGQLFQSAPTLTPGRTLAEAAAAMAEHQLDALVVASQSAQLVGVLTDELILKAILAA